MGKYKIKSKARILNVFAIQHCARLFSHIIKQEKAITDTRMGKEVELSLFENGKILYQRINDKAN